MMQHAKFFYLLLLSLLVFSACSPQIEQAPAESQPEQTQPEDPATLESTDSPELETPIAEQEQPPAQEDTPTTVLETQSIVEAPAGAQNEFSTDFSIHSVPYDEILSGGPPKDGIPPINQPKFVSVNEADDWIGPQEPIIQVSINQEVKGYPIQILTWHEIVNDSVGGVPVVVSFCPLCNTAIVFRRTVQGQVLDFGTTGRLRFSNLIMYDRQSESWWQQATGEGIVGSFTGTKLALVPAAMISWEEFKGANPTSRVLSRDTGYNRPYGSNPYVGYDDINNPPFLYQGPEIPGELPPVARIIALEFGGEAVAYPYDVLADVNVINDRVGEKDVAIFWAAGTASALDTQIISEGQDVGSAIAYDRNFEDQVLSFRFDGQNFVDNETGSTWDILGRAVSGALSGGQLTEVVSVNYLWFAWAAFKPETIIYQPDS